MKIENNKKRSIYLAAGIAIMLSSGVIYAWSILKVPFENEFGWSVSKLAANFTITMCSFCIGGFAGGKLSSIVRPGLLMASGGILAAAGFAASSALTGGTVLKLYIMYGTMTGFGIGVVYVVTISTVSKWFPLS